MGNRKQRRAMEAQQRERGKAFLRLALVTKRDAALAKWKPAAYEAFRAGGLTPHQAKLLKVSDNLLREVKHG